MEEQTIKLHSNDVLLEQRKKLLECWILCIQWDYKFEGNWIMFWSLVLLS